MIEASNHVLDEFHLLDPTLRSQDKRIGILGINNWSRSLSDCISPDYFIDDFTDKVFVDEIPIFKCTDISDQDLVINCSIAHCGDAYRRISCYTPNQISYYELLYRDIFSSKLKQIWWWKPNMQKTTLHSSHKFIHLLSLMSDPLSKNHLRRLQLARLNASLSYFEPIENNEKRQYLESFLIKEGHENSDLVIIDVGAYDGASSLLFSEFFPNYQKILAFEPETKNYNQALANSKKIKNCFVYNSAVGSSCMQVFIEGDDQSCMVKESSNTSDSNSIEMITLDSLQITGNIFLKIDTEGFELEVLKGAKYMISKYRPLIAVAAYHKINDIFDITEFILSLNPNYKMFFRHYTQGLSESVLFFV